MTSIRIYILYVLYTLLTYNLTVIPLTARTLTCYCDNSCPNNESNGTCETRPGGSCFSAVQEVYDEATGTYEEERTYGCMPPEENGGLLMVSPVCNTIPNSG